MEPVPIEAFIAKGAIEALKVRDLNRAARLNVYEFDAMLSCPRHKRPASEFRSFVGSHFVRLRLMGGRSRVLDLVSVRYEKGLKVLGGD